MVAYYKIIIYDACHQCMTVTEIKTCECRVLRMKFDKAAREH